MKLSVKSISDGSQRLVIDVPCDVTVDHFRALVAKTLSVSDDQVRLVFAGRILENGNPLSAYDVYENASIITIVNKQSKVQVASSRQSSTVEPTGGQCGSDSSADSCIQSAKRPKLDCIGGRSLVRLIRELIWRACEFSSDRICLSYDGQKINDDASFYKQFPQASLSEMCPTGIKTCDTSTRASGKVRISSSRHVLVIRITRERLSKENICGSFDFICEIEKCNDFLTAHILHVSAEVGIIALSSIPSSKPNNDHPIDLGQFPAIDSAQLTHVFFYNGSPKFIRDLIAKESKVKTYLVFLEMHGYPVHDCGILTAYCIHGSRNPPRHELLHRIFCSPIEEIAYRMNKDVCSRREFLSYIAGLPEIQPLTADPNNIRKMLLTYPLLKRLYKRFSEIKRILHWNDYLLYRLKMFKNPECLPSSDYVLLDPVGWNQLRIDWPVVQQLYVRYPEIRPILMWEEYLSYRNRLVTNPSYLALHREVVKNQDRVMSQCERYSEYSSYMLSSTRGKAGSSGYEHHPYQSASEVSSLQNPNYSVLGEPGEEIKSSDDDLKTYFANLARFADKLLKNCPQFNEAVFCNPYMQCFIGTLAADSRLIDGIIEETTPEVKDDPRMLAWAREEIPKIMKQLCDPEGREKFLRPPARDDDNLDPASQVMNALNVLRNAGYPVSDIVDPTDE